MGDSGNSEESTDFDDSGDNRDSDGNGDSGISGNSNSGESSASGDCKTLPSNLQEADCSIFTLSSVGCRHVLSP